MSTQATARTRLTAVGLMLALTACTAQESTEAASSAPEDSLASAEAPTTSAAEESEGSEDLSPFQRELGGLFTTAENDQDMDVAATKNRIEELTADCMAEQGFDYIPTDYSLADGVDVGAIARSMTPLEFAQQYGYGLSTYDLLAAAAESTEYVDPNAATLAAMSDAERQAWDVALHGEEWVTGAAVPEDTPIEERGCAIQASSGALPQSDESSEALAAIYADPRFTELIDAMDVEGNPSFQQAMNAIASEWTGCMADAGYPGLEGVWAGEELVQARQQELYIYDAEGNLTSEPTTAQVTELREYEIAVATADVTCQEDIDYTAREQQARYDAEQRILDAHREDVEALKIAIQQAQGE